MSFFRERYGFLLCYFLLIAMTVKGQNNQQEMQEVVLYPSQTAILQAINVDQPKNGNLQWYKDGQPIVDANEIQLTVSEAGIYTVSVKNEQGCWSEVADPVQVIKKEKLDTIDVGVQKKSDNVPTGINDEYQYRFIVVNSSIYPAFNVQVTDSLPSGIRYIGTVPPYQGQVNYKADQATLNWKMPLLQGGQEASLSILVKAEELGTIENIVRVTTDNKDSNISNNHSIDHKDIIALKIPNIFTPNGDGINDEFHIDGLDLYPENEVLIYNIYGNMIFHANGYLNNWTGEGLNEGTYYYVLRIRLKDGKWKAFNGYVTLLKK